MLNWISGLFKALNANQNPAEIAHALALGVMLGFMPKNNALWYLILVFFFFVRINKPTYLLTLLVVSYFSWMLDPLFSSIGYTVLTYKPLEGIFGFLVDVPFVGFTKFNNTIVMGSFLFSLALYIPVFFFGVFFVKIWRTKIAPGFIKSPLYKAVQNLPVIGKIFEAFEEKF
ncbi:MAG: TIGR03546 family protein [Treponema sp.]|nr:TIGR03546 family protein [Treponema sp.]